MDTKYQTIDTANWKRREHFDIYRGDVKCGFSLTVKLDISAVVQFVKMRGYKFYPVMIYLLSRAVNQHAEFKMAMRGSELICWDRVDPIYTILHKEAETFSALSIGYQENFTSFLQEYEHVAEKYSDNKLFFPEKPPKNHFNISALPWIHFDSFNLNVADFSNYFSPTFTIGKYKVEGDKTLMPLAIQVHHAVCDGLHVAKLIDTLEALFQDVESF
ncbi:type A chloramphenicol O-acetyltransferase [Sphingobacterium sp. 2149]|uniref:type A chloramphenicol O-acetyltransferase n=1 Tax=Sphingobacterium sp. 2149 TaxID=2817763 RepID=UPI001AE80103|nr:type A chloramphenicol O-acetyltransferase [Sphingobacterium sp. 2149]MDR6736207.1 chloramphenicol O-acetyltransferase type A [Sphingobacterium sp. 2149]